MLILPCLGLSVPVPDRRQERVIASGSAGFRLDAPQILDVRCHSSHIGRVYDGRNTLYGVDADKRP